MPVGTVRAHDVASQVTVEQGEVIVDGPDGVAVTLTKAAARETGRRLSAAGRPDGEALTTAIGWTSIAFGVFDWVMARRLAAGVGMTQGHSVFRMAAARELVTGLAAVRAPGQVAPVASRLVGDVADLMVLGITAGRPNNPKRTAALAGVGIVAVVTAVDLYALMRSRSARVD